MISETLSHAFLQAAGQAGKGGENIISLSVGNNNTNLNIRELVTNSAGSIEFYQGGELQQIEFSGNLGNTNIPADKNSIVKIIGDVIILMISNTFWSAIDTTKTKEDILLGDVTVPYMTALKLGKSTYSLSVQGINESVINEILTYANNQDVVDILVSIISEGTVDNGTLYIDQTGTYASTIIEAAQNRGWTIEPIPA